LKLNFHEEFLYFRDEETTKENIDLPQSVKKSILLFICLLCFFSGAYAFTNPKDSVNYYLEESKKSVYTDFNTTKRYLLKAERCAHKSNDKNLMADVLFRYGSSYYILGSYDIALQKYIEASKIYEAENNELGIAKCLMGKGIIQQSIGRDKEALVNFSKSIELCRKISDDKFIINNLLNLGVSNSNLKNYAQAYKNFSSSLKLSIQKKYFDQASISTNKLAYIHYLQNNIDSSLYYYQKVLNDSIKPNLWEESFALSGLSEAYLKKEDYNKALLFGLKGYQSAKIVKAKWDIARAAKILSEIYSRQHDFKLAYDYLKINEVYSDSLYADSKIKQINILQLEAKEAENQRLSAKAEIAQQKLNYTRIFVIFIICVVVFLLIIIYLYSKNNKQKEKLNDELEIKNNDINLQKATITSQNLALEELNQTKNRIFSVLSHDLRSPINSLVQAIELTKGDSLNKEEQNLIYEQLQRQVEGTSQMLTNILNWANSQFDGAVVHFEKIELNKIIEESIKSFHRDAFIKKISFIHADETPRYIKADIGQCRIIVQNVIANAVKFAPHNSKIEIFYSSDKAYQKVHIKDFGNGLNQNKIKEILNFDKRLSSEKGTSMEKGTGLGLLLVKEFLKNNEGKLEIESTEEKMTEFIISFLKY